ncbi:Uncharacterised protein [Enterobacter hormaechei]|nr:Uncharacterised protein [Enterobacter hormaechei]SAF64910.1 Uncharacterised protein [Enterobacter hormaechei]
MLTQFFHRHDALTGHLLDSHGSTFKQLAIAAEACNGVHQRFQRSVSRIETCRAEFNEGIGQRLHRKRGVLRHIHDVLHILCGCFARVGLVLVQPAQHDAHTLHFGGGFDDWLLPAKQDVSYRSCCITNLAQQENITAQTREHAIFSTAPAVAICTATSTTATITTTLTVAAGAHTYRLADQLLAANHGIHLIADFLQPLGSLARCDAPITETLRRGVKARIHATHGGRGFFYLRTEAAGALASERCPIGKLVEFRLNLAQRCGEFING